MAATRRLGVSSWLLAATIVGSALSLGSLHTEWLAVWTVLAAASAVLAHWKATPLVLRPPARLLLVAATGLTAFTALQATPFPISIVRSIAPNNADVWARALSPLHEEGPTWITFSLDPVATRVEVLRGLFYLLVILAALPIAKSREGTRFLSRALVAAGVAMSLAALAHPAVGAKRVFGTYAPLDSVSYEANRLAPLLNTNHLAGFVNIGMLVAASSLLTPRHPLMPRSLALGAALLLVGTNLFAASRGGTAAMAVALTVLIVTTTVSRRAETKRVLVAAFVLVMLLVGTAMIALSISDTYIAKMAQGDFSKLRLFVNAADLLRAHPVFGVGRGAFEASFPAVRTGHDYFVFTHPENLFLQWSTEWGLPVAIGAFGLIAYALLPRTPLGRSLPPLGAWSALVSAFLHNIVDFNSEVPGVVCSLVACAAICTAGTGGGSRRSAPRRAHLPRAAFFVAALAFPLALFSAFRSSTELAGDQRTLRTLAVEQSNEREEFHIAARSAMLRHPAEPYLPFTGALRAATARDESVIPWAERALERSPVFGRVHLLLARSLFMRSPSQARLEYRLAFAQDGTMANLVEKECLPLVGSYDDAMELVPDGVAGLPLLSSLAMNLGQSLPATQIRLDEEITRRDPTAEGPLTRGVTAQLKDLRDDAPWCSQDRSVCVREGLASAEALKSRRPSECNSWELHGRMLVLAGDVKGALDEVDSSLSTVEDRNECGKVAVELALENAQPARAEIALDRLTKMDCTKKQECIDTMLFAAQVEVARRNPRRAIFFYQRAFDLSADGSVTTLKEMAGVADANGLHREAIDAYTRLLQREPNNAEWRQKLDEHEAAVRSGVINLVAPNP
jgi:tetratricopeptide (TPR) repeat protein